jgi:hypothetical protein
MKKWFKDKDSLKQFILALIIAIIVLGSGVELIVNTHEFYLGLIPIILLLVISVGICVGGIYDSIFGDHMLECAHIPIELWDRIKHIIEEEHPEIFEEYKNKENKED